jgi:predicted HD superfamily hydrolase involved in NAD metabolism
MYEDIKTKLETMLKPERYIHSLGVAESSEKLANRYGYDAKKAYLVGLLHDCAKNLPKDEQLKICDENNMPLDNIERIIDGLIHAKTGVVIAKSEFGLEDPEMLNAIAYHATGRENMTLIEKIVYLADMIEPSRKYNLDDLRREAFIDIDNAIIMQMNLTISHNLNKNSILNPRTILARNYLLIEKLDKHGKK